MHVVEVSLSNSNMVTLATAARVYASVNPDLAAHEVKQIERMAAVLEATSAGSSLDNYSLVPTHLLDRLREGSE